MEVPIKHNKDPTASNYSKSDMDLAYEYGKQAYKEFGKLIKGLVIFGSVSDISTGKKHGDIDILVVLDDITIQLTPEVLEAYKVVSEKLVSQVSRRLHITTLKFTTFWDLIRNGDPVGINILREGHAVIDSGFFDPMQALLYQGRIKPTPESVHAYFAKAPRSIMSAEWHLLQGVVDMYWAVIDATQAAIMHAGEIPPAPKDAEKIVKEKLIKPKHIPSRFSGTVDKFYHMAKDIMHKKTKDIQGDEYHRLLKEAKDYVDAVRKYLRK